MLRAVTAATLLLTVGCVGGAPDPDVPRGVEDLPAAEQPPAAPATGSALSPRPPGDPARGEVLFAELGCKGCHGGKGEGGGIGPDLFSKTWDDARKSAARATILRGFPDRDPPMPGYRGQLDEAQLDHLLAFVSSE